ncbi:MAG: hypothetical protein P4L55_02820, partial [Syntrophobacteraceae bacterium]|nr:hypothetical protein [Syntrophobacteraceae bacterium]
GRKVRYQSRLNFFYAFHGPPFSNPNYDDLVCAEPIKIDEAERHKCDAFDSKKSLFPGRP